MPKGPHGKDAPKVMSCSRECEMSRFVYLYSQNMHRICAEIELSELVVEIKLPNVHLIEIVFNFHRHSQKHNL